MGITEARFWEIVDQFRSPASLEAGRRPVDAPTPGLLILVPARAGSKGLPRQEPRGSSAACPSWRGPRAPSRPPGLAARAVLSTDDAGHRRGRAAPTASRRPSCARPRSPPTRAGSLEVVEHAVGWLEREAGSRPSAVMLLQPTCPFRRPERLRAGPGAAGPARHRRRDRGRTPIDAQPVRSCTARTRTALLEPLAPWDDRIRRQDVRPLLTPNGTLYLATRDSLARHRRLFPPRLRAAAHRRGRGDRHRHAGGLGARRGGGGGGPGQAVSASRVLLSARDPAGAAQMRAAAARAAREPALRPSTSWRASPRYDIARRGRRAAGALRARRTAPRTCAPDADPAPLLAARRAPRARASSPTCCWSASPRSAWASTRRCSPGGRAPHLRAPGLPRRRQRDRLARTPAPTSSGTRRPRGSPASASAVGHIPVGSLRHAAYAALDVPAAPRRDPRPDRRASTAGPWSASSASPPPFPDTTPRPSSISRTPSAAVAPRAARPAARASRSRPQPARPSRRRRCGAPASTVHDAIARRSTPSRGSPPATW